MTDQELRREDTETEKAAVDPAQQAENEAQGETIAEAGTEAEAEVKAEVKAEAEAETEERSDDASEEAKQEAKVPAALHTDHLHGGNWKTGRKLRRREHHDLARRMNTKMLAVRVAIVTTLLFLGASAIAGVLYYEMIKAEERYHAGNSAAAEQNSALLSEKEKLQTTLADLQEERSVLQKQLEDLDAELRAVKAERDDLIESNSIIKTLQEKVTELEAAIAEKDAQIAELKQALKKNPVDLVPITEKLLALQELLKSGAPLHTVSVKKTDEYGNPYFEDVQVYPNLSLSVQDRETGMVYQWEVGKAYESGELARMIYALALLECATEERAALENSDQGGTLTYDLTARYTLMPEDLQGGSGILQNETAGKVYTYLDLIEILLSYNDSIAYQILLRRFEDTPMAVFLTKVEAFAGRDSLDKLTASDLTVILDRMQALIDSDSPYATRLKNALTSAVATYYSQASTTATAVGRYHSLTATGHHEIAIRYDDTHAMTVVLLTDITVVTPEWGAYLISLYQSLNDLMLAFRA